MNPSENEPPSPVRVRMYRQGLGDCFLLIFPRPGQPANFNVLIDCGVLLGTVNAVQKMAAIVEDIHQATGGVLDLVVATHEHWDHLSGFIQARKQFDQFRIKEVWLAWTEDPNNATAQALRKSRAARLAALRAAANRMSGTEFADVRDSIEQVLGFFGETAAVAGGTSAATALAEAALAETALAETGTAVTGPESQLAAAQALTGGTTGDALQYLISRKDAAIHYCYPSKEPPHKLEGVKDVRVYVFGPPEDLSLLKMSDPTQSGKQTYGMSALTAEDSFFASVMDMNGAPANSPAVDSPYSLIQPLCYPFDNFYRVSPLEARSDPFFLERYGFNEQDPGAWRRINSDWLTVTSELALSLDNDTNNTSLVLAFELGNPGSGKVLLFAADAQVGNWLSWSKLSWPTQGRNERITVEDLLSRTVLYKVGHHGSHNATLRQTDPRHPGGLELMTHDDLVAMIPVDQNTAAKRHWSMPFPDLFTRLQQKTRGRVLISDSGLPAREEAHSLTESQWNAFLNSVKMNDLYIEYCITI